MTLKNLIGLILFLAMSALPGCGGGGGSPAGQNAQANVTLTPSKTKALANGLDAVTIQADVKKTDGTAVEDGTAVNFLLTGATGTLSAPTAVTSNGLASVSLTSAGTGTITVTADAGGAAGSTAVKFISQPSRAEIAIAFNQAITNLAALSFKMNISPGVAFDNGAQPISAINAASASQSLVVGNFNISANNYLVDLINGGANGFNTGTTPIIRATFSVNTVAILPVFSVDSTPASFLVADPGGAPTTPPAAASDLVVTVTYDSE